MKRWPYFPISAGALFLSFVTSIVILFLGERIRTVPTHEYLSEHKQLYESWMAQPFVEVAIEDASVGCQNGFEHMLYREWPGTKDLCESPAESDEILSLNTYHE